MRLTTFKKIAVVGFFVQALIFIPSVFAGTQEVLSGRGGGRGSSGETVARQSGGGAALDTKNEKPNDFQSSARFFVGGAEFAGGYTNLSTETGVKVACAKGKAASKGEESEPLKRLCNKASLKKFDAAAKVLGVPSVVLACLLAQRIEQKDMDEDKDDRSAEEREADDKASQALRKKIRPHYLKISGTSEDDRDDNIFSDAFEIFWMLETVAKPMKDQLMAKDSYWDLVMFAVTKVFGSRENAKKGLQSGKPGANSKESQKAFAGVKKCIEEARSQHDSKSK